MRTLKTLIPLVLVLFTVLFSFGYSWRRSGDVNASDSWYLLSIKDRPSGYMHVSRRASDQGSASVMFVHDIVTRTEDESRDIHIQTYCEDDPYYYPVKATATIRKPGNLPATLKILVQKKFPYGASKAKMFITYDTGTKQYNLKKDIPAHTVPSHVLMEIIPLLPFQEGTVFEFNLFDTAKLKSRKNHRIDYLGLEEIQISGQTMNLHKFRHKGSGVKETFYWTDDNHRVIRCLRDKKEELLLSTQAEVKRLIRD
ncbi:MAG: hypothetical protein GWP14_02590 [Actinobacteria bacterium]|nr:hypothetical protein [Actinomycetota bacterium]